ncbi:MAG TPA: transposase [Patescibacteria group bacterium]|nr:transposase [Patescibacteria group bacterium]
MPKGQPSVSKEVKEQILKRIRDDGIPVAQIAGEHGLKPRIIYSWLGKSVTDRPSILEVSRLRRENQALKELLGQIMLDMSLAKKKNPDG